MSRKLTSQITRLSDNCVRVQIAPEYAPMRGSALNKYGFIFEDALKNVCKPALEAVEFDSNSGALNICTDEKLPLAKLLKTEFTEAGALVEFDLFDDSEDWIGFGDQTRERLYHRGHKANCNVSNV